MGVKKRETRDPRLETKLLKKLDYIEKAITAKGHPLQDHSTVSMVIVDLVNVMRAMLIENKR